MLAAFNMGCKSKSVDPEPTDLDKKMEALGNNNVAWTLTGGSVEKDGFDVSSQFDGFTLAFGEFTYETENGLSSAWPAKGTWSFISDNPNKLKRDDGVEMDATISGTVLTLKFNVTNVGGRGAGIDGAYTFILENK